MEYIDRYDLDLKQWGDIVLKYDLIYPHEAVARFAAKVKPKSVIDFGCATGRHLLCFARNEASRLIGVDINEAPLALTAAKFGAIKNENEYKDGQIFKIQNATLELFCNKNKTLDDILGDTKTDALLCWGVLHLFNQDIATELLRQFNSHLNSGGHLFINLRSQEDGLKNEATKIGENTYKIDRDSHKGLVYSFYSPDDAKKIIKESGFKILYFDKEEFTQNNGKIFNSFHIIHAIKE